VDGSFSGGATCSDQYVVRFFTGVLIFWVRFDVHLAVEILGGGMGSLMAWAFSAAGGVTILIVSPLHAWVGHQFRLLLFV
jgi:hypothetical protein